MVIFTTPLHGRMDLQIITCTKDATYQSHLQTSLESLDDSNRTKVTLFQVQVKHQSLKCQREGLLPAKRLCSSVAGPLSEKTKCVWCLKGEDTKHPNRAKGKMFRINTHSAWLSFKRHTALIQDEELRDRLSRLVESTSALSDPFATDIMYHTKKHELTHFLKQYK